MTNVNLNFKIVFQPYDREKYMGKRRFAVGGKSLKYYVGEDNAQTLIEIAMNSGKDKLRQRLRTHGIIDFYSR